MGGLLQLRLRDEGATRCEIALPLRWCGIGVRSFELDVEVEGEGLLGLEQDGAFVDLTLRW